MANQKPLPALPSPKALPKPLTTLSVEARSHRGRLVRLFLADACRTGPSLKEDWGPVLEEVLDELGKAMGDGWLAAVRRGRNVKMKGKEQWKEDKEREEKVKGKEKEQEKEQPTEEEKVKEADANAEKPLPTEPLTPLDVLRKLAARPPKTSGNEPKAGHLVLCVAPHGSHAPLPAEDEGFDLVPANIGCVFEVGMFALQGAVQVQEGGEGNGTVLFGLDGVDTSLLTTPLRLLGGTFTFKGLTSAHQHRILSQVLRLSIYTHLSLILEQHVLAGLGVQLRYPTLRPKLQSLTSTKRLERSHTQLKTQTRPANENEMEKEKERNPSSHFGSGLRRRLSAVPSSFKFAGFFARNYNNSNLHLNHRAQTDHPPSNTNRGRSLDLEPLTHSVNLTRSEESPTPGWRSMDGHRDRGGSHLHIPSRLQRFSFLAKKQQHLDQHPISPATPPSNDPSLDHPFAIALAYLERNKDLLSTSPGVSIPPPKLLIDLAAKERSAQSGQGHGPGLGKRSAPHKGDERVGLGSLLGWDGNEANPAAKMGRTQGFARQQGISVLWGIYLPADRGKEEKGREKEKEREVENTSSTLTASSSATSSSGATSNTTNTISTIMTGTTGGSAFPATSSTVMNTSPLQLAPCTKPRWATYRYYSFPSASTTPPTPTSNHPNTSTSTSTPQNTSVKPTLIVPPTDAPLGDIITAWIRERHLKCSQPSCSFERGRHQRKVVHGAVGISIDVGEWECEEEAVKEDQDQKVEQEGEKEENETKEDKQERREVRKGEENEEAMVDEKDSREEVEVEEEPKETKPQQERLENHPETKLKGNHLLADLKSHSNSNPNLNDGSIQTWSSCAICGAKSPRRMMDDGMFLFSFAKFLELLVYSPALSVITPPLCEHTRGTPSTMLGSESSPEAAAGLGPLPASRFNIVQHFGLGGSSLPSPPKDNNSAEAKGGQVTFTQSKVEDVFELCVPRLQVTKAAGAGPLPSEVKRKGGVGMDTNISKEDLDHEVEQKRVLRREIKKWWEGVADHVDKIEKALDARDLKLVQKALPRLPSVDDAYDLFEAEMAPGEKTPKGPSSSSPKLGGSGRLPASLVSSPREKTEEGEKFRSDEGVPAVMEEEDKVLPKVEEGASALTTQSVISVAPTLPPKDPPLPPNRDLSSNSNSESNPPSNLSVPPNLNPKEDSALLLASLRHTFHRLEQDLYAQLAKTPEGSLNDVRRAFVTVGRGTEKRLGAWQEKHLKGLDFDWGVEDKVELRGNGVENETEKGKEQDEMDDERQRAREKDRTKTRKNSNSKNKGKGVGGLRATEPEWWGKGCHVLPGGNVVVREGDWGSIIAHTLSTTDYQMELANLNARRHQTAPTTPAASSSTASTAGDSAPSSFFSVATKYKLFGSDSRAQPDPDTDDAAWNEQEQYSAIVSRKEHSQDAATTLLSLRDVLRQRIIREASTSPAPATLNSQAETDPPGSSSSVVNNKAEASVSLSKQAAGGQLNVNVPGLMRLASPSVEELEGTTLTPGVAGLSTAPATRSDTMSSSNSSQSRNQSNTSSEFVDGNADIRRAGAESVMSRESEKSEDTIRKGVVKRDMKGSDGDVGGFGNLPPPLPPKDPPVKANDKAKRMESQVLDLSKPDSQYPPADSAAPPPTSSSIASTLASGIQSVAMRLMMQSEPVSRTVTPSNTNVKKHHNLLANVGSIDEHPHIKYDWMVGKRLKFSCTVYYAKQFDLLRRKCGVQDVYLKSLSRSVNWAAEGGKSKSNFWKTSDERFIIKTLVNAWNVADLQVLMELAPSYFRYMDTTASKATVLAKMIGFYTVELRNMETGTMQSKADVLVMENLFYDRNISKTFDLKGIHGRKVKAHVHSSKTLFDGEWIDGQQRTLTLVHPHSKVVLRDAIKSDAEYLAKSNIMDYSLLVGVDEEEKQIACGLVDTIGSYTFAKTLEYKAKHGLQTGGKEVTVVPPNEYHDRFVNALSGYFVACPDKWSKPQDESTAVNDPNLLPSIL